MSLKSRPPPLPPRLFSETTSQTSVSFLSPYPDHVALHSADPRTSSTQSLVPSISESETRRRLLVVYIHGFYGNNQSFRSFPAHVHACLTTLLADSHVVHSKIYPRYKTYKAIEVARDNFSAWLEPHESPRTDVILVGHSMGGLLAAEVVLMPNRCPYHQRPFKHGILGIIAIDSPFLGLHPGIVISGIASLFQPSPKLEDVQQQPQEAPLERGSSYGFGSSSIERLPPVDSRAESIYTEASSPGPHPRQPTDPFFDPPFYNDAPFREQPFVKRLMNFTAKHRREGLFNAMGNHINSHLEFGGCLADYRGLNMRYNRLRALEDVDEIKLISEGQPAGDHARVRFVNYYTLSPGRPNPPKPESAIDDELATNTCESTEVFQGGRASNEENKNREKQCPLHAEPKFCHGEISDEKTYLEASAPSLAFNSHETIDQVEITDKWPSKEEDQDIAPVKAENANSSQLSDTLPVMNRIPMHNLDPMPLTDDEDDEDDDSKERTRSTEPPTQDHHPHDLDLPAIPDPPEKPTLPDPSQFTDKDAKKQAEKEGRRLQKAHDQAIKDHNKAVQEREKLIQKRRKRAPKEAQKKAREAEKERLRMEKEEKKRLARQESERAASLASAPTTTSGDGSTFDTAAGTDKKKKKLKKFCSLPSEKNGVRDSTWIDVYMEGMDEVGAHCGLFFSGPHYDKLVGDVGTRVAGWVGDDLSKRAVLDTR
ncbi:hypothetical protein C2857_005489 [Epichloe festucae Fl1]|uniref:DUF676 domain-containing protein n=1 Tax=Epichloe festucae (strain Fl1) TaxID=877507 RepID=A0A7S9KPS2_EPIFF|nr:hypothetical protein C2857_005489 [Epichloe festucae Fl1]